MKKYKYRKKNNIQRMILFTVELFANVKCFGFLISNLHQGVWICDVVSSEFYLNQISIFG